MPNTTNQTLDEQRAGKFKVQWAPGVDALAEEHVGEFRVQVYEYKPGDLCYRVLIHDGAHWMKVRCWDDRDERIFPKRAAKRGTAMVREIQQRLA